MSIRITTTEKKVALFDSVTGFAFGPTFDHESDAESFLKFAEAQTSVDLRVLDDAEVEGLYNEWLATA